MCNFRQITKWFKLVSAVLLMSIIVNTTYAAASCACVMDTSSEMSEMMDCHTDEAHPNMPSQKNPSENNCCPACIMLYAVAVDISLISVAFDSELIVFNAREVVTQNITPLYRPPIIRLL